MKGSEIQTGGEPIPVRAFDSKGNHAGDFKSIGEAARKLFIRKQQTIWGNVFKVSKTARKMRGVTSYKDGQKYTFFQIKNNQPC